MNIVGGLARIVTVLHYGIGVLYLLLFSIGFMETGISKLAVLGSLTIVIGYYAYLDLAPDARQSIGELFAAYPIMTGLSLIWTDIFLGAGTGFYFFLRQHWPSEYLSGINLFTGALVWIAPIALLFGSWHLLRWIIVGFSGRSS